MRTTKLKCGCEFANGEREQWTKLCPAHLAEFEDTHGRWAEQHRANPMPPRPEPAPRKRR